MTKARDLADLIATGNPLSDGAIAVAEVTGAAPLASPTFTGDVTIPDKIVHSGDTNTAIRFADADTVTVETGGSERMRVDSSGRLNIAATTGNEKLNVSGALGVSGASANFSGGNERALVDFTGSLARFGHVNGASGSAKDVSILSGGGEKFRFGSSGQLGIGGATYGTSGQVLTSGGASAAPTWADAGGGAYELITKTTISSNASEIIFDSVSAPQQQLLLLINGLQVNNSGSIIFHYRNSSGGNLNNTGGSSDTYRNTGHYSILNSAIGYSGNSTGNGIYIGYSQTWPGKDFNGSFRIFNFGTSATGLQGTSSQMANSSTGFQSQDINSQAATSAATAGIRLYITNSREFTSGEVYLYKLV